MRVLKTKVARTFPTNDSQCTGKVVSTWQNVPKVTLCSSDFLMYIQLENSLNEIFELEKLDFLMFLWFLLARKILPFSFYN